jgi:DNA-binding IclR family transcriptional regulator
MGSKVDLMHAATGHVILAHLNEDARERAIDEWRSETKKRKPVDLDEHLTKILARGHERRASYEVAGVVNISFPVLNVQGQAIAGLTVPFVKRIEDTIGIADAVNSLGEASKRLSEAMGATPHAASAPMVRPRTARKKPRLIRSGPETPRDFPVL